jgi:hypothetical protein
MSESADDARRLTFTTLDTLWGAGNPIVLPVQGDPICRLLLDPKNGLVTLVTSYQIPEPDLSKLKNVSFRAVSDSVADLAEITVRVEGNAHGAYGLLATIADELQIAKTPLALAVATGVARHRDILAARGALSTEQEVGLYGELLFLEHLVDAIGAARAVSSWQGPLSEEHDYVFAGVHLEVKTTSAERRRHVIHGLSQLVPLRGVPLCLLSIQLTRSSQEAGRTLPALVAHVRRLAGGHVVPIDQRLEALGWDEEDADLYPTFWTLRTQPRAYFVKGHFPAMTAELIEPVVPNFGLLSEVSYRVDLTDLDHDNVPDPVAGFAETRGK